MAIFLPRPPAPRRPETENRNDVQGVVKPMPPKVMEPAKQVPALVKPAAVKMPFPPRPSAPMMKPPTRPVSAPNAIVRPATANPGALAIEQKPAATPMGAPKSTGNGIKPPSKPTSAFSKIKPSATLDMFDDVDDAPSVAFEKSEPEPIPEDQKLDSIKGTVKKLIYATPEGYQVYILTTKKEKRTVEITVTVTSTVKFNHKEKVIAQGSWGTYKGKETFKAVAITQEIAKGAKGVVSWLNNKVVNGVGKATAERIASHFGDDLPNVIGLPEELVKAGIPFDKAEKIAEAWNNNVAQPELVEFLGRFNLGPKTIANIINRYGAACRVKIERNPWQLAEDIDGISFLKADEIAQMAGHDMKSEARIRAGLKHSLERKTGSEGHCGLPRHLLVEDAESLLKVGVDLVEKYIDVVLENEEVLQPKGSDLIYPVALFMAERKLVRKLQGLLEDGDRVEEDEARAAIEQVVKRLGFKRDESQINAALMAVCNPVSIITGGPGTGKSTTQKIIVEAFKELRKGVWAAAPTGRAAKRLSDVSGMEASTCHRLLKYDARAGGFLHDASNPFQVDRLIIDEFSMVDIKVASSFFDAIKSTSGITIVGDVDQLPSVGPGQVLRDAIDSGALPVTRLQTVHRQSGDSGIVIAAANIRTGRYPIEAGSDADGFELIANFKPSFDEVNIRKTVVDLMADKLPAMGYNPIDDVQVLSPMRIGPLGIDALNEDLKARLNPLTEDNGITLGSQSFSIGDRVMHLRNDYEKSVFNGEVGVVEKIGEAENENGSREPYIMVDYSGHKAFYKRKDVNDIMLSWAATVHKSQGCEFPVAVIVCANPHRRMLNRNLIYTAITRAKKLCIVVGHKQALEYAIANADVNRRFTGLDKMLGDLDISYMNTGALGVN